MRRRMTIVCLLASAGLAVTTPRGSAQNHPPGSSAPTERLCILGPSMRMQRFQVEIADRAGQRAVGLMHRRHLPVGRGMLFLYPRTARIAMWMKNTFVSLDMIFIDAQGVVRTIVEGTTPLSEKIIDSGQPVAAVLEVNAGEVEARGIAKGDRVLHSRFEAACPAE